MSFLASPQLASVLASRSIPMSPPMERAAEEEHDLERQANPAHGREASGRSVLSTISGRLANMRERERETERTRQSQRAHAMAVRLLNDLNNWRAGTTGQAENGTAGVDVEGQTRAGAGGATGQISSMRKLTGKSRREREEGAALFGPNLANYFGSGSSSSGAIAGSSAAATAATVLATDSNANPTTPSATDLSSTVGSSRRPRLGSRGRARGASLSGLGSWISNAEAIDSVPSLNDPLTQPSGLHHVLSQESLGAVAAPAMPAQTGSLAMAEGIEIDTLRRWIERSRVGGTVEIRSAEEVEHVRGDAGNPPTLCSTLQSYVNLKRNTVKLLAVAADVEARQSSYDPLKTPLTPASPLAFSQLQSHVLHSPAATHTIQFEYDCAAPFASVQVFVRASRKHGSWLTWSTARETLGLSTDLTIGAADDGESRYFGQRGPPPHVLGWPVHVARVRKGFSAVVKVNLALQLDLYAPPKAELGDRDEDASAVADKVTAHETKSGALKVPPAAFIPETPGIDASRRLDDPVTPAAAPQPVSDPLLSVNQAGVRFQNAPETAPDADKEETKEGKAARERAERETLKVAIVIETLDEDGKPLKEPNLQTTYMRLASMPIRESGDEGVEVCGDEIEEVAQELHEQAGAVLDVAIAPEPEQEADVQHSSIAVKSRDASFKRAWSVQVEGQEAEIGPHRFQLQELYGLSSRPPPPQQQQAEQIDGNEDELGASGDPMPALDLGYGGDAGAATECLICLSSPPTTLLLPCTHGLCLDCAVQLRDTVKATRETERRRGRRPKRKYACPVCRRIYTSMLHLRAVDEKYLAQATIV